MKIPAQYALTKAIRTFAQSAAAGLGAISLAALTTQDLKAVGTIAVLALINAGLAGVIAFLQNFAEQLPEE